MRCFIITGFYSGEYSNQAFEIAQRISGEREYPNRQRIIQSVRNSFGKKVDVTIANIMELSEKDFEEYTR